MTDKEYTELINLIKLSLNELDLIKKKLKLDKFENKTYRYTLTVDDLKHEIDVLGDFPEGHEGNVTVNCNQLFNNKLYGWSHTIYLINKKEKTENIIGTVSYDFN